VHDQAFLLGVAVEACNRAQPTGNGCSSPPPRLELPAEALDVDTVHLKEAALMIRTPHRELSQIQRALNRGAAGDRVDDLHDDPFLAACLEFGYVLPPGEGNRRKQRL